MNRSLVGTAALAVFLMGGVATAGASPAEPPDDVGEIKGLAWDAGKERLWFAGDDADAGTVIGATDGADPVTITFHADLVSVQGLAMANGALYVGDIGDENGEREFITVYRFPDTGPSSDKKYFAYDLAYPDGAKLHATALMVAADGTFYVVTDGDDAGVFVAPDPSRAEVNIMERVGDAPAGVSDAVMLSDDLTGAVRTPEGVTLLDTLSGEVLGQESQSGEERGEAIASLDESTLILASGEGVRELAVPAVEEEDVPDDGPIAEESAGAVVEEVAEEVAAPNNAGTIVALVLAGIVSLAAAVGTYLARP